MYCCISDAFTCTRGNQQFDVFPFFLSFICICWVLSHHPLIRSIFDDVEKTHWGATMNVFVTSWQGWTWKILWCNVKRLFTFSHRRLKNFLWFEIKVFMTPNSAKNYSKRFKPWTSTSGAAWTLPGDLFIRCVKYHVWFIQPWHISLPDQT